MLALLWVCTNGLGTMALRHGGPTARASLRRAEPVSSPGEGGGGGLTVVPAAAKVDGWTADRHDISLREGFDVSVFMVSDHHQQPIVEEWLSQPETDRLQQADPFGNKVWPSALATGLELIAFAERFRDGTLRGVRVVELGAGTGVPSLTAALLGADVVCTDLAHTSLRLVEAAAAYQQAGIESSGGALRTQSLDLAQRKEQPLPECDLVIVTDLLFNDVLARHVAGRCIEAHRNGYGFMVASPPRRVGEKPFLAALDWAEVHHRGFQEIPLPTSAASIWPEGKIDPVIGMRPATAGLGVLRVLPPSPALFHRGGPAEFDRPKEPQRQMTLKRKMELERLGRLGN